MILINVILRHFLCEFVFFKSKTLKIEPQASAFQIESSISERLLRVCCFPLIQF